MRNPKKQQFGLHALGFTIWPLAIFFAIPILLSMPRLYSIIELGAFLIFLSIFYWVIKKHFRRSILFGLAMASISLFLLISGTGRELHLGKQIAYVYIPETPAYEELKVYYNGVCMIGYGGIFGTTDRFYCPYTIERDTFFIDTEENASELFYYGRVELEGKEFPIKRLNSK